MLSQRCDFVGLSLAWVFRFTPTLAQDIFSYSMLTSYSHCAYATRRMCSDTKDKQRLSPAAQSPFALPRRAPGIPSL